MPAKLLVQSQDGTTQEIPFDRARITIGRKAGNDLHFNRPEISGTHAEFLLENDEFFVSDLGSTNGTMMNGAKLLPHQKYALQNGDLISIAPFRIQFVADRDDITDTVSDDLKEEEVRAGSGTMVDINGKIAGGKISTGTEEHQPAPKDAAPAAAAAPPKEEAKPAQAAPAAKPAAPPPPPPKPQPEAKPSPPPPAPAAARQPEREIQEAQEPLPPIEVPKGGADYLWLGLGAVFLLLAIGLIVFLLMQ